VKLSWTHVLLIIILLLGIVTFFLFTRDATSPGIDHTNDAPLCPVATPEFFLVEPVTSPTDQLSQIITVDLGNGETITVTSESGAVVVPFDAFPKEIEIPLLPNTTHHLTVEGKVQKVVQGECVYGDYILSTTTDRNGGPLVIEQRQD